MKTVMMGRVKVGSRKGVRGTQKKKKAVSVCM